MYLTKPVLAIIKKTLAWSKSHTELTNLFESYGFEPSRFPNYSNKLNRASTFLDHQNWNDEKKVSNLVDLLTEVILDEHESNEYRWPLIQKLLDAMMHDGYQWSKDKKRFVRIGNPATVTTTPSMLDPVIEKNPFTGKILRIFLSHSSNDKKLAGNIKHHFEDLGISVFVAHDDIEPCEEWEKKIRSELKSCDILLLLLTKDFSRSKWTDQETGFALAEDKLIIPLKVEIDPYGFVGKIQAIKFSPRDLTESCKKILHTILKDTRYCSGLIDSLITVFAKSHSYLDASAKANLLDMSVDFTNEQINEIIRVSIKNDQIYGSFDAQKFLRKLLNKFSNKIDKESKRKLEKLMSSDE